MYENLKEALLIGKNESYLVEELDELVHDVKSTEASAINNNGLDSQIAYLFEAGLSITEIEKRIS